MLVPLILENTLAVRARVTRDCKKCPISQKESQKMAKILHQSSTWLESPKYLHQTTFETLKEVQQTMIWIAYSVKMWKEMIKQRGAQKEANSLATLSFQKITNFQSSLIAYKLSN